MHDTAAHLVDRVLPRVPIRQWVVTFPRQVRYHLAADPKLAPGDDQRHGLRAWPPSRCTFEIPRSLVRESGAAGTIQKTSDRVSFLRQLGQYASFARR
jgi:hypothetical protein